MVSGRFFGLNAFAAEFVLGETSEPPTSVEDAIDTMRVVEAAYLASARGGVRMDEVHGEAAVAKHTAAGG